MLVTPAYAQAAAGGAGAAGTIAQFVPLILIFVIMYMLMIRPQQKKMKEHRNMVANLRKGDQIVTQGGILGKVTNVRDDELEVEVAQGVRIRIVRNAVQHVINKTAPVAANG